MQLLAYQIFAFAISIIFLIAVNFLRNLKQPAKNETPTKYLGASPEDVERMLNTLCEESCYFPFDHFENAD
jgi:hypothetical protein